MSKRKYHQRKEERRCVYCGAQDSRTLDGKITCFRCSAKESGRDARRYQSRKGPMLERYEGRKAEGRCVQCGCQDGRTLSGHVRCIRCSDKRRVSG